MLLLFVCPIIIVSFAMVSNPYLVIFLYILSGFGMAGIGMGIMHDANHSSFSKYPFINKMMANSIYLVGASKEIWRIQHNVLHHSFTNIEGYDDDINPPSVLRFTQNQKKRKIHKFQHLYAWLVYGLTTLSWATSKDYLHLKQFNKMGLIKNRETYKMNLLKMTISKLFFIGFVLVIPALLSGLSFGLILLSFLVMQILTGLIITLVFQAAHMVPNTIQPSLNEENGIETDRMTHQLLTTSNFSQKSGFLFWAFGGLTNQVEHHLFPHISHVHYKKLAPIVQQTANEFNIPYHIQGSFFSVIKQHFGLLKQLGR